MAPEGWKHTTFGQLADFRNGLNFTRDSQGQEVKVVGIPRFWGREVASDHSDLETVRINGTVDEQDLLQDDDLLFVRSNGNRALIGRCLRFTNVNEPIAFSGFTIRARIDRTRALSPFLAHVMRAQTTRNEFMRLGGGTNISNLSQGVLAALPLNIPPLPEQRRIAEILGTWDRAITVVDSLVQNLQSHKRAMMQRLFPGNSMTAKKSHYTRLLLKDVASVNRDALSESTAPDYTFGYVSLSDVTPGCISTGPETQVFATAPSRARRKLQAGDILMSTVRPNLQAFALVTESHEHCIASTGFAVLSPNLGFDSRYLYHYLYSSHLTAQINALVVGSNYPAINASDVENLAVYCPPLDTQRKIGQLLSDMDEGVANLLKQRERLVKEKEALMQQLLTGKRRVRVKGTA